MEHLLPQVCIVLSSGLLRGIAVVQAVERALNTCEQFSHKRLERIFALADAQEHKTDSVSLSIRLESLRSLQKELANSHKESQLLPTKIMTLHYLILQVEKLVRKIPLFKSAIEVRAGSERDVRQIRERNEELSSLLRITAGPLHALVTFVVEMGNQTLDHLSSAISEDEISKLTAIYYTAYQEVEEARLYRSEDASARAAGLLVPETRIPTAEQLSQRSSKNMSAGLLMPETRISTAEQLTQRSQTAGGSLTPETGISTATTNDGIEMEDTSATANEISPNNVWADDDIGPLQAHIIKYHAVADDS